MDYGEVITDSVKYAKEGFFEKWIRWLSSSSAACPLLASD
jgi:hypothetical protein